MVASEMGEFDARPRAEPLPPLVDERDPRNREAADVARALHELVEGGPREIRIEHAVGSQPRGAFALGGARDRRHPTSSTSHTTGAWSEGRSRRRGEASIAHERATAAR